jgi:twinkle protein
MAFTYSELGIELKGNPGSAEAYTTCPRCSPSRKKKHQKCLTVYGDTESFFCHHCGWYGSLERGELNKSKPTRDRSNEYFRPLAKKVISIPTLEDEMYKYFESRSISRETVEAFGVWAEKDVWMPQFEGRVNAIRFPYFRAGELVNVKTRGPSVKSEDGKKSKTFRMETQAERIFFGLDTLLTSDGVREQAIIVEGEIDALAVYEAGFRNFGILSVPNGAPGKDTVDVGKHLEFIHNSNYERKGQKVGILDEVRSFYIAVDNDEPGKRLEDELIRRLGPERCMRVQWPEVVE